MTSESKHGPLRGQALTNQFFVFNSPAGKQHHLKKVYNLLNSPKLELVMSVNPILQLLHVMVVLNAILLLF